MHMLLKEVPTATEDDGHCAAGLPRSPHNFWRGIFVSGAQTGCSTSTWEPAGTESTSWARKNRRVDAKQRRSTAFVGVPLWSRIALPPKRSTEVKRARQRPDACGEEHGARRPALAAGAQPELKVGRV